MIEYFLNWEFKDYIELFAVITSIIYMILAVKEKVSSWYFAIITSIAFIYVFLVSKFYADMSLQFYYITVSVYGWYLWKTGAKSKVGKLKVRKTKLNEAIILAIISVVLFVIYVAILKQTDDPYPYADSFTTALSITATWMLAKKQIEHWIIWLVINAVSIFLYFQKDLHFTAFLYVIYFIAAIVGYIQWRKDLNKPEEDAL